MSFNNIDINENNRNHIPPPFRSLANMTTMIMMMISVTSPSSCFAFTLPIQPSPFIQKKSSLTTTNLPSQNKDVILDAEIVSDDDGDNSNNSNKSKEGMTLLDLAFSEDPSYAKIRLPFIDPLGNNFIECKPHYVVDYNGVSYTIGTPHDHTIGICYEDSSDNDGSEGGLVFLDPSDKNDQAIIEDVFKIASMEISKSFNDEVHLKRTPWTFTIQGDLDKIVKLAKEASKKEIDKYGVESLIEMFSQENTQEDEEYLDAKMREILGDEYVELDEVRSGGSGNDDDALDLDLENMLDPQILELFDNGIPDSILDAEDIETLMDSIMSPLKDPELLSMSDELTGNNDNKKKNNNNNSSRTVGERLLNFQYQDKFFSLVKMSSPAVLIGRQDPQVENRRVLLTPQESALILPNILSVCEDEFKQAGLV